MRIGRKIRKKKKKSHFPVEIMVTVGRLGIQDVLEVNLNEL